MMAVLAMSAGLTAHASGWQTLAQGLDLGKFAASLPSPVGDRTITVLRVDPAQWRLQLYAASQHGSRARTAAQWAQEFGLVAVTNAGMFQMDGLTNVGYMKCDGKVLNPRFNDDNSLLAMVTDDEKLPQFQLIDREAQDWRSLVEKYKYVTQGIRMVDARRRNRWSAQPRMWSIVAAGMDGQGRALLTYCRSPYPVHDYVEMLLKLDIDLKRAMYLEGGPEASLYIKHGNYTLNGYGSYETGFFESDDNDRPWPIPNVIGISARK